MKDFSYTPTEIKLFQRLNTPEKLQDYINKIPFNFDEKHDSCLSPREVLKRKKADCIEGAIFAAAVLEFHGRKPLLVDLRSVKKPYDYDHVIAIYKVDGHLGAISKTNHSVLRYREPIYRTLRELVMTFFHEYFLTNGDKTLREYSVPLNLNYFNKINWRTSDKNLSEILVHLDKIKHHKILTPKQIKNLRKVDKIEIKGSWEEEHQKK